MGGDSEPDTICALAEYIHEIKKLKVGWYSGKDEYYKNIDFYCSFDFFENFLK